VETETSLAGASRLANQEKLEVGWGEKGVYRRSNEPSGNDWLAKQGWTVDVMVTLSAETRNAVVEQLIQHDAEECCIAVRHDAKEFRLVCLTCCIKYVEGETEKYVGGGCQSSKWGP